MPYDLIHNPWKLTRRLAAFHLRLPMLPVEVIDDPLEDADEDHRLAGRAPQVLRGAR